MAHDPKSLESTEQSETKNKENVVPLQRYSPLHLRLNTPKGRGVFASLSIPAGTILDTCPVLILSLEENAAHIQHTQLYHYTYNWPLPEQSQDNDTQGRSSSGKTTTTQALILGLGSMFNHSLRHQNVGWHRDLERQVVVYRTLRDVAVGEELCISYGSHLTFRDAEAEREREEEGEEVAEEMLGRIEV